MKKQPKEIKKYDATCIFNYAKEDTVFELERDWGDDIFYWDINDPRDTNLNNFSYTDRSRFYIAAHGNHGRDPDYVYEKSTVKGDWLSGGGWSTQSITTHLCNYIPKMEDIPKNPPVVSLVICSSARKKEGRDNSAYFDTWAGKLHTDFAKKGRFVNVKARNTIVVLREGTKRKTTIPVDKQDIYVENIINKRYSENKAIQETNKQPGSKVTFSFEKNEKKIMQVVRDSYTNELLAKRDLTNMLIKNNTPKNDGYDPKLFSSKHNIDKTETVSEISQSNSYK